MLRLFSDVSAHHLGCHLVADGGGVIPLRPEVAAPKRPLELGELEEHFARGDALEDIHDLGRRQPRWCFQEEVNMILHDFAFHDGQVPLRHDAFEQVFEVCPPNRGEEPLAIFRNPDQVVFEIGSCVASGAGHANIVTERKRLSSPADIESA